MSDKISPLLQIGTRFVERSTRITYLIVEKPSSGVALLRPIAYPNGIDGERRDISFSLTRLSEMLAEKRIRLLLKKYHVEVKRKKTASGA